MKCYWCDHNTDRVMADPYDGVYGFGSERPVCPYCYSYRLGVAWAALRLHPNDTDRSGLKPPT